jgi:phosphocarrier protein HPr
VIRIVVVGGPAGLHARVAEAVARTAAGLAVPVTVRAPDRGPVPADSVLGLLSLAAGPGTELVLDAPGAAAAVALYRIATLLESGGLESDGVARG